MVITNVYQTSFGKMINTQKIIKELQQYLISTPCENLNYEYLTNNEAKLVFITGCNKDEKDLGIWNYPLVFKNLKDQNVIAVDLRKYVKDSKEQPIALSQVMKDVANSNFVINSSLITSDFLTENFGEYRNNYNSITAAYSVLVSYLVNIVINLSPVEKLDVELASNYFANLLLTPGEDYKSYHSAILARMSNTKFSLPVTKKSIEATIDKLDLDGNVTIKGLVNIIKNVLPEEKASLINETVLLSLFGNMWYGNGGGEALVISLESMPLWISIVYTALSDKTFNKTRLSNILDKANKQINSKEFVKDISNILKQKRIDI